MYRMIFGEPEMSETCEYISLAKVVILEFQIALISDTDDESVLTTAQ